MFVSTLLFLCVLLVGGCTKVNEEIQPETIENPPEQALLVAMVPGNDFSDLQVKIGSVSNDIKIISKLIKSERQKEHGEILLKLGSLDDSLEEVRKLVKPTNGKVISLKELEGALDSLREEVKSSLAGDVLKGVLSGVLTDYLISSYKEEGRAAMDATLSKFLKFMEMRDKLAGSVIEMEEISRKTNEAVETLKSDNLDFISWFVAVILILFFIIFLLLFIIFKFMKNITLLDIEIREVLRQTQ